MKIAGVLALVAPIFALPRPQAGDTTSTIDPTLVPAFGLVAGIPSTSQLGSCQGSNDVNIPCSCPQDMGAFIQRLEQFSSAGNAFGIPVTFSDDVNDMSVATQLDRVNACIVTLQNFDDTSEGVGCPAASAPNFLTVQASLLQQLN